MTTGCLRRPETIAGDPPHVVSVATVLQLLADYAAVVCLIDREAASLALNATGQEGINLKTLYQASTEQTRGLGTTCTRRFMRIVILLS